MSEVYILRVHARLRKRLPGLRETLTLSTMLVSVTSTSLLVQTQNKRIVVCSVPVVRDDQNNLKIKPKGKKKTLALVLSLID